MKKTFYEIECKVVDPVANNKIMTFESQSFIIEWYGKTSLLWDEQYFIDCESVTEAFEYI
jgi:hypothetical protein